MIITSQEQANGVNRTVSNTVYGDVPILKLVMPNRPDSFAIVTAVIECSQDGLNEASLKLFDSSSFQGSPKTYKQTVANAKVVITLSAKVSPLVGQTITVQVKNPVGSLTVYGSPDNQTVMNSLEITPSTI